MPIKRNLYYGKSILKVKSFFSGVDIRNNLWKKKALDMLLYATQHYSDIFESEDVVMVEIGAANGLVTLFVAKALSDSGNSFSGYCIEPNLQNCSFIEDVAALNGLNIIVLPFAVGNSTQLISFSRGLTKGYVGNAVTHNNYDNYIFKKPMISVNDSLDYINSPNVCYIDAFLNEIQILESVLSAYRSLKILVIEFDSGFPLVGNTSYV